VSQIQADVVSEGLRLARRATEQGLPLRLVGGVAIGLRARDDVPSRLVREYGDLDWVATRGTSSKVQSFFKDAGYSPQTRFNALNGKERLMFWDDDHERQVDVFVGAFRMCHEIPMDGRLEVDELTVPLAELLLTKLQVVQLNEKDITDALTIVHAFPVGDADGTTINAARIAEVCASDWGVWRTFTANLATCHERLADYGFSGDVEDDMAQRLTELEQRISDEPKSRRWRLRAKIGERKRWYDLPEEVKGGPE
jgi:hypothetical protein